MKNGGCPYFGAFLADFGKNFINFANFLKYCEISGEKRKKILCQMSLKMDSRK